MTKAEGNTKRFEITEDASEAYVELNNLYSRIQSGQIAMTLWKRNYLVRLVYRAYGDWGDGNDSCLDHWFLELGKLPGFNGPWITLTEA